jgi:hypothetical protein
MASTATRRPVDISGRASRVRGGIVHCSLGILGASSTIPAAFVSRCERSDRTVSPGRQDGCADEREGGHVDVREDGGCHQDQEEQDQGRDDNAGAGVEPQSVLPGSADVAVVADGALPPGQRHRGSLTSRTPARATPRQACTSARAIPHAEPSSVRRRAWRAHCSPTRQSPISPS